MQKGINMSNLKQQNRVAILKLINNNGAMARKDIASLLKLTPAAVTIIISEMIEEGLLIEVGEEIEKNIRAGRKKILVDINYDYKYIIGISIETDKTVFGITNLKGDIIDYKRIYTEKHSEPIKFIEKICTECIQLLWENNLSKDNVIGAGVGIVGAVDIKKGISKHAYGLWDLDINIKQIIESILHIPVVIDNNVRALAVAELDFEIKKNTENMIFIKCGPGIGSSIILEGNIYYGSNSNAGEIGHTIVNYDGEQCICGKRGCLETVASSESIINKIKKILVNCESDSLTKKFDGTVENIALESIFSNDIYKDENINKILDEAAYYMAMAIANSISLYDPNRIVLYGEIFRYVPYKELLLKHIKEIMNEDQVNILHITNLDYKKSFIGGIAIALRKFFYS